MADASAEAVSVTSPRDLEASKALRPSARSRTWGLAPGLGLVLPVFITADEEQRHPMKLLYGDHAKGEPGVDAVLRMLREVDDDRVWPQLERPVRQRQRLVRSLPPSQATVAPRRAEKPTAPDR